MKTILLVRHGQASFGQDDYDKLSSLGEIQTKLLGDYYANQNIKIDGFFSGSMVRHKQSVDNFLAGYSLSNHASTMSKLTTLDEFNEFDHQEVLLKSSASFNSLADIKAHFASSNNPHKQLAELFYKGMVRWHSGKHDNDYSESWTQFCERANTGLAKLIEHSIAQNDNDKTRQSPSQSISIVFTSGGVIAAISASLLKQGSDLAFNINRRLVNAGVTSLMLDDTMPEKVGKPKLLTLNACEHLQQNGQNLLTWY